MKELPIKIDLPDSFFCEEVREGYKVSETMKAVWAVELDLYEELKRVCDKYSLKVFADGGTMLGAVRHKGFIPWDDDMDLCMPRADYEKLCAVATDEFQHPYFWQTEETDPGTVRGHGQLRNSETSATYKDEHMFGKNQGIFIDVFPLDNVPDDVTTRTRFLNKLRRLQIFTRSYQHLSEGVNKSKGPKRLLKELLIKSNSIWKRNDRNPFYEKAEALKQKYNEEDTETWALLFLVLPDNTDRWVYKKRYYDETVEMDFETIKLTVPRGYEEYLNHCYGNWKEYVIGNNIHGNLIFDPYNSYQDA